MRKSWYVWLAVAGCLIVLLLMLVSAGSDTIAGGQTLALATASLFDVGVTDVNRDGNLDIYTVNHGSPQSVLVGNGKGAFAEVGPEFGLDYDPQFPGLADADEDPDLESPGLYIYWRKGDLVIRAVGLQQFGNAEGKLSTYSPVDVRRSDGVEADIVSPESDTGVPYSTVRFSARQNGSLELFFRLAAQPIQFEIDPSFPITSVFVGHDLVNPTGSTFQMQVGDRHGMAWADYNHDGKADVFILRGGLRGMLGRIPVTVHDELFVGTADGFENRAVDAGLYKDGCSGRQVAWVDFDRDGLLDLFAGCDAVRDPRPNQLFRQLPDGSFEEVGIDIGLAVHTGVSAWFDMDNDGDDDFFWIDREGASVFRNDNVAFTRQGVDGELPGANYEHLSVADFDLDGDFDVFAASRSGNALFINGGGYYRSIDPEGIGLPRSSVTANWVDVDNDGLTDLHAVPNGLYQQTGLGQFESVPDLPDFSPSLPARLRVQTAIANWFDADNDGDRDLVIALTYAPRQTKPYRWLNKLMDAVGYSGGEGIVARYYPNSRSTQNWLEVELIGDPGNRPALGAKVEVTSPSRTQIGFVGQAEGAHYSQGHYRMYFGLGTEQQLQSVTITWPDGTVQTLEQVPLNQILRLAKNADAVA